MILSAFYEAIMERTTSKIPAIKHFDYYYGQDEPPEEETELPFLRPAVFFEYDPQDWESLGNKKQASEASFNLHVVSDVIQEIDKRTAPNVRNLGHAHLHLLDDLCYWLTGFSGNGFNSISRIGLDPYKPNGMMIKHVIKFKTRLTDNAAARITTQATPSQDVITIVLPE